MDKIADALRSDDVSPRVYVGNLNPGVVRHEFLVSMLGLVAHDVSHNARIGVLRPMLAGGLMDVYRNMAMEDFIVHKQEWFVNFDSDMVIPPTTLDDLLTVATENDLKFVSGLYFMSLDEGLRPNLFRRHRDDKGQMRMTPFDVSEIRTNELMECDGTGFGCVLIHRSLIVEMYDKYGSPMPWFQSQPYDGISYGEDFDFCMRAAALGHRPVIHTAIECGHVKNYVLTHEMAQQWDTRPPNEMSNHDSSAA